MDNFFTGSKENIAHLLDKPNFELIRHDVTEPIRLEVDQIYHLACPASPVHYKLVSTGLLRTAVNLILSRQTRSLHGWSVAIPDAHVHVTDGLIPLQPHVSSPSWTSCISGGTPSRPQRPPSWAQ